VKKRMTMLATVAAAALAGAVPVGSANTGVGSPSFYQSGSALFRSTSGCITTFANVTISRDTTRPAGVQTTMALELNRFDTCTGVLPLTPFYREDSIVVPDSALQFDNELEQTRLDLTVGLQEQTTLAFTPVTLHLAWNGTGPTTRTVIDDGTIRTVVSSRAAAVTGSISDGTTAFADGPSVDGTLFLAKTKPSPPGLI
jgi:hypothetical protein